jgi:hypothetical protein
MKVTEILTLVMTLIMIFAQAAEEFLGAGTGTEKKKVVVEVIQKLIVAAKWEKVIPVIIQENLGTIVDIVVFFYNAVGAFQKKS